MVPIMRSIALLKVEGKHKKTNLRKKKEEKTKQKKKTRQDKEKPRGLL
jgi:hypothetical protein